MKHPLLPGMVIFHFMVIASCTHNTKQIYPTKFIRQDLSKLTQIGISTVDDFSGNLSLFLKDNNWLRHESYSVDSSRNLEIADTEVLPMLEAIRYAKIKVLPSDATTITKSMFREPITVYLYFKDGIEDQSIIFGSETIEKGQPYTYVSIGFNDKEYTCLAEGHLRNIFDKNNYDFHEQVVVKFSPLELKSLSTTMLGYDTLLFLKNEFNWESTKDKPKQSPKSNFFEYIEPTYQQESDFTIQPGCIPPSTSTIVRDLLHLLPQLNGGQRLDKFNGEKTMLAKVFLVSKVSPNPITLTIFKTQHHTQKEGNYLIHSSTAPDTYFLQHENNFIVPIIMQHVNKLHKRYASL